MANTNDYSEGTHGQSGAELLGLEEGLLVQELGWDDDVDEELRESIMDVLDAEMVEDAVEAVDVVVLWWRDEDGDVVDGLVDALPDLSDAGYIWLLTPKVGRPGYVNAATVAEGVAIAGLALTSTISVAPDWQASKVVRSRGNRR
ncbi:MAG TPA: DUF3052 domain-containing protein [Arachnia sp.]|nr:DUF3052 domain-containing protein [Arachnia sp.]HMT86346.1 DUF3052 domain-containing protein [Arachnia sp.]